MPVCSAKAATFFACAANWVDCTARTLISLPAKGLPGVSPRKQPAGPMRPPLWRQRLLRQGRGDG